MKKIKTLILTGYGLNCEDETAYAFNLAGAEADKIHINSLIEKKSLLKKYKILALVGGFSWGDDHGAGVLEALRLKTEIGEQILEFIEDDKIIIGICNGFQTLVNMGLLPGFADYSEDRKKVEKKASSLSFIKKTGKYKHIERLAGFTINNSGTFVDKWVYLKANKNSPCVFTKNITELELPVRHAEGKFFAEDKIIKKLIADNQVVIRYADSAFRPAEGNPLYNPNGSTYDIAGICDSTGRIFGLMPHPESFNSYMNHPNWTLKREISARSSAPPVEETEKLGIKIFQNAVKYFR